MNKSEWSVVSSQWSASSLNFSLSLLALVLLSGCAGRQEIKPSKPLPPAVELISHIEEGRGKVSSLKGMASVKAAYNGKESNVKEVLVVKRPSKIRAETVGLFGNPVFTIVLDGPALSIYKPAENIFYKGSISSHEIKLPFPLDELRSEDLSDILLGSASLIKYGNSRVEFSDAENSYILTLTSLDGFKRQVITIDTISLRLKKNEIIDGEIGTTFSTTFDNYQDIGTLSFPKEIKIQFVNRPDTLQINYEEIELNKYLPDELFVLTPP